MLSLHGQRGFSLVELMIALVVGLLVSLAVVSFLSAAIRNNAATASAIRLTQELRALTEVVARDLRRARAVADPIANVGSACSTDPAASNACLSLPLLQSFRIEGGDCVRFGYAGAAGGDFRVIRREVENDIGVIRIARGDAAIDCDTDGTPVSSGQVDITGFAIAVNGTSQVDLQLSGRLAGEPDSVIQTYSTSVFMRSGGL